jgi:hypothetical protein
MSNPPSKPAKPGPSAPPPSGVHKGIRVFTYPKIIFIWPTLVVSIVCSLVMASTGNQTHDPTKHALVKFADGKAETAAAPAAQQPKLRERFLSAANMAGLIFLFVFFTNLLIMAIDFPRFTIIAMVLSAIAAAFFLMWLNVYAEVLPPLMHLVEQSYVAANSMFYALVAFIILVIFVVVWVTRYLDYWEIMPNEILHHHGPLSDLERYPTMNMKFDKEIPDILEYMLLRSGRLVLHFAGEKTAVVLDNVLWIDRIEDELKKLLSRMEVRVTTDQETAST